MILKRNQDIFIADFIQYLIQYMNTELLNSINAIAGKFQDIKLLKAKVYNSDLVLLSQYKEYFLDRGFLIIKNFFKSSSINLFLELLSHYLYTNKIINEKGKFLQYKGICLSGYTPLVESKQYTQLLDEIQNSPILKQLRDNNLILKIHEPKYLNGIGMKQQIELHSDYYRFKGKQKVLTTWIPLANLTINNGTLVIGKKYDHEKIYEQVNDQELPTAFKEQIQKSVWYYNNLEIGDLVILDYLTIYGSFRNNSESISMYGDIKWSSN